MNILNDRRVVHAQEILNFAKQEASVGREHVYVICGRPGPTGKTWLWNKLNEEGFAAVEISETIGPLVAYEDNDNHMSVGLGGHVLVVLNRPIDLLWKLDCKGVIHYGTETSKDHNL